MNILYVSPTRMSGTPERMTIAVNQYTSHEARCLLPALFLVNEKKPKTIEPPYDVFYQIKDEEAVEFLFDWADVIHFFVLSTLFTMNRMDLLGDTDKKICYQMSSKWHDGYIQKWDGEANWKKITPIIAVGGWERDWRFRHYNCISIPTVYLVDSPYTTPLPLRERKRRVAFSPRTRGQDVAAPRNPGEICRLLGNVRLRYIYRKAWKTCMLWKRESWLGIDDIIQPFIHNSGFEFLSVGVPCMNQVDEHINWLFREFYGASCPFIHATRGTVAEIAQQCLSEKLETWHESTDAARVWMLKYSHPRDIINRYIAEYEK